MKTVLVVDDEPLVLELTTAMLEDVGCEVITATSGTDALAKIAAERLDLVITDINMPVLSGYELAERAKGLRPDLQIILMSGRDTDGRGLPLIRKPFLQSDLTSIVSQTVGLCRTGT
jgi:CheY-like chemotaxis protein